MIKSQAHKKEMYATQFLLNWSKGPLKKKCSTFYWTDGGLQGGGSGSRQHYWTHGRPSPGQVTAKIYSYWKVRPARRAYV